MIFRLVLKSVQVPASISIRKSCTRIPLSIFPSICKRFYSNSSASSEPHPERDTEENKSNSAQRAALDIMNSLAQAKNINGFLLHLDEYKANFKLDKQSFEFFITSLSKLGLVQQLLEYFVDHNDSFSPIPSEFRPKTSLHAEEYLAHVKKYKNLVLSPTVFTSALSAIHHELENEFAQHERLLNDAEGIFEVYEEQILDSFDKIRTIATEMKKQSMLRILQDKLYKGNVENLPYKQIYEEFLINPEPFLIMAKIYKSMDLGDDAIEVLQRGYSYQPYEKSQLENVFGEDAMNMKEVKVLERNYSSKQQ